ncbi:BcGPR1, G protein-coupled receptor [Metarhizium guizhouense ARSEF 977]|uniref:BcGPR1, G protein-coupled receptor n=1 Tax=Metarhizium guizhouense (strain ARSEF 977) TaxID=1276136 RepID=A0A0B4GH25_METGA|nr:BcGPR1, G protein-coupled receptor [Metarhizium guizhouense ARSEF 977]
MPLGHHDLNSAYVERSWLGPARQLLTTFSRRDSEFRSFSQHQLHVLWVTSLIVASVSVVATMFATFWFVRMRRSFRHKQVPPTLVISSSARVAMLTHSLHSLLLLLIQSNMLQAMWFVIVPAVQMARGFVASDSPLCQVSGFFLALGIEACDVAVVLVSLHTALYIFRGSNGLYPYRRVAYCAFVLVPLLLSSLAFINKPAFSNSGQYCYLPANPDWVQRALSWVPRYITIVTICVAHLSTYFYIDCLVKQVSRAETASREALLTVGHHGHRQQYSHSRPARRDTYALEELRGLAPMPENRIQWKIPAVGMSLGVSSHQQAAYLPLRNPQFPESCVSTLQEPVTSRMEWMLCDAPSLPLRSKSTAPRHSSNRPLAGTATSSPSNTKLMLHREARSSLSTPCVVLSPAEPDATSMDKRRDSTRRQVRRLFIYPIVYILAWIMPFVNHVTPQGKSSFGLMLASVISLCVQGIADSLVFSILEKPWRHPRLVKGSGWRFWCEAWPGRSAVDSTTANIGRSREEALVESRIALRRRNEELVERRMLRLVPHSAPREWWDMSLGSVKEPGD